MNHRPIRENDEWYCPLCGKRWEVDCTDIPPCTESKGRKAYRDFIKKLFNIPKGGA